MKVNISNCFHEGTSDDSTLMWTRGARILIVESRNSNPLINCNLKHDTLSTEGQDLGTFQFCDGLSLAISILFRDINCNHFDICPPYKSSYDGTSLVCMRTIISQQGRNLNVRLLGLGISLNKNKNKGFIPF